MPATACRYRPRMAARCGWRFSALSVLYQRRDVKSRGHLPRLFLAERAALVHIDSDLYPSAREVLFGIEPILQDGTMLCFDDWFMYRGDPGKGEARAFREFLAERPRWQAIPYQTYSVFCRSFLLHLRSEAGAERPSVAGWDET